MLDPLCRVGVLLLSPHAADATPPVHVEGCRLGPCLEPCDLGHVDRPRSGGRLDGEILSGSSPGRSLLLTRRAGLVAALGCGGGDG